MARFKPGRDSAGEADRTSEADLPLSPSCRHSQSRHTKRRAVALTVFLIFATAIGISYAVGRRWGVLIGAFSFVSSGALAWAIASVGWLFWFVNA